MRESSLTETELNEIVSLWEKSWGETIFQWENILGDFEKKFQEGWKRQVNLRSESAKTYNIFEITNRLHYEVTTHSNFLSHLLDPLESHDQGDLFLNMFLRLLERKKPMKFPSSKCKWEIECENSFLLEMEEGLEENESNNSGRLDILLRCPEEPNFTIIIENKIYASDQKGQLAKYWEQIKRLSPKKGQRLLIYLSPKTPKKQSGPSDISFYGLTLDERREVETELLLLSYQDDIAPMLEGGLLENGKNEIKAPVVKETVKQYLRTLEVL